MPCLPGGVAYATRLFSPGALWNRGSRSGFFCMPPKGRTTRKRGTRRNGSSPADIGAASTATIRSSNLEGISDEVGAFDGSWSTVVSQIAGLVLSLTAAYVLFCHG